LDFLGDEDVVRFAESLAAQNPDGILITGDISLSHSLVYHLSILERVIRRPIYFVLGNHDHYGSSVAVTRQKMKELNNMSQQLKCLSATQYISVSPKTALVGHDGWYDAGHGTFEGEPVMMNDWVKIKDYEGCVDMTSGRGPDLKKIVQVATQITRDGVNHVAAAIKAATRYHKTIAVATHVPPFVEVHQFERPGGPDIRPWYTSRMMGDMLRLAASSYPNVRFEVFSGHTHNKCDVKITDNLYCHVGRSEYGLPSISSMIELP
jgi:predicted MPP superfamily phosphohydrolase